MREKKETYRKDMRHSWFSDSQAKIKGQIALDKNPGTKTPPKEEI